MKVQHKVVVIDAQKVADRLVAKWKKDLKAAGGHIGTVHVGVIPYSAGTQATIEVIIETDINSWLRDLMVSDVNKSEYCRVDSSGTYPGHYDWKSGTYIKDDARVYIGMDPTY